MHLAMIHYSDSPDVSAATINEWHRQRGFEPRGSNPLKYIGYHWVVHPDGSVEAGRSLDVQGTHCPGYNAPGVMAICMTGSDQMDWYPTKAQYDAAARLIQGQGLSADQVTTHRQHYRTNCPGSAFDLGYLIDRIQGGASTVRVDVQQIDVEISPPDLYRGIAIVNAEGTNSASFKIKFPAGLFSTPPLLFLSQPNTPANWGANIGSSDVSKDGATVYIIDRGAQLSGILGIGIRAEAT